MGKLHVFEETGEVRAPKTGEWSRNLSGTVFCAVRDQKVPQSILRRLTDAEVDALVAAKPADDERVRFVRETAGRMFEAARVTFSGSRETWIKRRDMIADECDADAAALADRLWEKRA